MKAEFQGEPERVAQRGLTAATEFVGTSGAGPWPNAVRPYVARKMFAKKTRIDDLAMQRGGAAAKPESDPMTIDSK